MPDATRATINRHLILVLPKQPALDWITRVDPNPLERIELDEMRQEQDVYLLPEGVVNSPSEAGEWAERRWSVLFASFLSGWFTDEAYWPKRRTRKMFKEWFEVQYHSMIWDLSTEPITHEEWD